MKKTYTHYGMRRANGTGSIYKLSGNRRNPWIVVFSKMTKDKELKRSILGYYPTEEAAYLALSEHKAGNECPYTFKDVYEMWSEKYFMEYDSPSSYRSVESAYNHCACLWDSNFASLTIQDLDDVISKVAKSASQKSRIKSLLNLMYDYAVRAEIVEINKARNFRLTNLQKELNEEHQSKLPITAKHIYRLTMNSRKDFYKVILIGIYTGFRPREMCLLEKANIHLKENYIIGGMKTEAGTNRYVPIHPAIKPYLKYFLKKSKDPTYLFPTNNSSTIKAMTYSQYNYRFRQAMKTLDADQIYSPHCTRHTFITLAKKYHMDEYAIKMIVGHAIMDLTENVYTHRDYHFLHQEISKLPDLEEWKKLSKEK